MSRSRWRLSAAPLALLFACLLLACLSPAHAVPLSKFREPDRRLLAEWLTLLERAGITPQMLSNAAERWAQRDSSSRPSDLE